MLGNKQESLTAVLSMKRTARSPSQGDRPSAIASIEPANFFFRERQSHRATRVEDKPRKPIRVGVNLWVEYPRQDDTMERHLRQLAEQWREQRTVLSYWTSTIWLSSFRSTMTFKKVAFSLEPTILGIRRRRGISPTLPPPRHRSQHTSLSLVSCHAWRGQARSC